MASFTLELYISPVNREQCLNRIEADLGTRPRPYYSNPKPGFEHFYRINLPKQRNMNEWDWARTLCSYEGVLEADPVKKILGMTLPQTGAYNSDEDYPEFDNVQWNHKQTNFPAAIEKSFKAGKLDLSKGTEIKIAHLDTGISRHQSLNSITSYGKNYLEDGDPIDPVSSDMAHPGHGTSTAGIIIGSGEGALQPSASNKGVFPYVKLMPYRISDSVVHLLRPGFIADAIVHAADHGCQVITMSMGGGPPIRRWYEAVEYAYSKGVIFCSAAGNNVSIVVWPARYPHVFAVAGLNQKNSSWEGSSHGDQVVVSAPGENVYTCRARMGSSGVSYDYSFGSGTSFATPHVAAAAALWLNHFKEVMNLLPAKYHIAEAFRFALEQSALPFPQQLDGFGKGSLDAVRLLDFGPEEYMNSLPDAGLERAGSASLSAEKKISMSVDDKEMIDVLLNNEAKSMKELESHISDTGSATVIGRYNNLISARAASVRRDDNSKETLDNYRAELLRLILSR